MALFYLLAKTQRIQINTKIFIFTITTHDLLHTAYSPQPLTPNKRAYSPEMVLTNSHKGREFHSSKGLSKEGRVMLFFFAFTIRLILAPAFLKIKNQYGIVMLFERIQITGTEKMLNFVLPFLLDI